MSTTGAADPSLSSPLPSVPSGWPVAAQTLLSSIAHCTQHGKTMRPAEHSGPDSSDPDASILLLGIRGTGKTTLAILASGVTGFNLLDADQHFYKTTGLSRAVYASRNGFDVYKAKELELMRQLLGSNPRRSIIVCGPGSAEGTGQSLIREIQGSHPIIYVLRDAAEIHGYLGTQNVEQISQLSELVDPSYRSLSNYEFYNLSEPDVAHSSCSSPELRVSSSKSSRSPLMLKHVEDDFLRLLQSIRSQLERPRMLKPHHSLSCLSPESKPYTYVLCLPLDEVEQIAYRLRSADLSVDAVQLEINTMSGYSRAGGCFDQTAATFITRQYYLLRRNVKLPVVIHAMPGDASNVLFQAYYLDLLCHCLRLAPEYLTVDLLVATDQFKALVARKGSTKIIGDFFDANPEENAWSSPERLSLLQQADDLGSDLIRISQPSKHPDDNLLVRNFVFQAKRSKYSHMPVIAYNTGRMGRPSLVMSNRMTPVSHDFIATTSLSEAEDRFSVQAARRALYASFVLDKLTFGIFGSAVSAAVSPVMHNAAFDYCGMPHVYQTFQSPSLNSVRHLVYNERFGGASISAPFKQEIMSIVDHVSPEAQAIGAVNTLIPLRSKALESLVDRNHAGPVIALYGDNTDWIGVHTSIHNHLSPINAVKNRSTALILGAGGMARAAIYAALRLGVQTIFVWNRTFENTERIVNEFHGRTFAIRTVNLSNPSPSGTRHSSGIATPGTQYAGPAQVYAIASMNDPWPSWADPPTIVVSCIVRVSRLGQPPPTILLPEAWLKSPTGGVVIELSYDPVIDTPLLQQIRLLSDRGWITVDGLKVLPEQGIAQFELFTGATAPKHLMRAKAAEWRYAIT